MADCNDPVRIRTRPGTAHQENEIAAVAALAIAIVAILHVGFLVMEMFLWTKPLVRRSFGLTQELADATASLAKNQGLYNGFLAAGLIWAALSGTWPLQLFFLGCAIVAGIFGGLTVGRSILWIQAAPGAVALLLAFLART
jgi:putative membrane protein